jgi:hypothetical protein
MPWILRDAAGATGDAVLDPFASGDKPSVFMNRITFANMRVHGGCKRVLFGALFGAGGFMICT